MSTVEPIKRMRKAKGVSLTKLASLTGLHRMALARAERPGQDVKASTVAAIAEALGVRYASCSSGRDMSEDERSPRSDKRSPRGVFERPKGSGVWWVCYFD